MKNASIRLDLLSEGQIGYIAAFLDGEGGMQITRTERKDRTYKEALHPTVYFTNTCGTAIETIQLWIGAGTKIVTRTREDRANLHVLHVTGARNIRLLLLVLPPYLIVKSFRARVMLEFCESRLSHYRAGDRQYNQ